MRLLAIFQRFASPGLLQNGAVKSLHWSSCSRVLNPEATFLSTLFSIVMSLTTAMFPLSEVRTVSTIAKPFCAPAQLFSKTFPLTSTRRALLNSRLFFTDHCADGRQRLSWHRPLFRFEEIVAADLYVRWNVGIVGATRAAEHQVLRRSRKKVVHHLDRPRSAVRPNRLRVRRALVNVGDVAVDHGDVGAVGDHARAHVLCVAAVQVATIHRDRVGQRLALGSRHVK